MSDTAYVLGSAPGEVSRLILQAHILRPVTERLLRQIGTREGMRVLDLGCGAGDVSMLAAEMVGPLGTVVGVDPSAEAVSKARARVRESGYPQISFSVASVEECSFPEPFDVVIGRYVLIHQPSPSDFLRAAQRHVRPGGVLAFHEVACHHELRSLPGSPLFQRMARLLRVGLRALPSYDAAGRLLEHFRAAELPDPELFAEVPVGGGVDSPLYAWMVATIGALMPFLVSLGVTEEEIAIDTLEERLRSEMAGMQSQMFGPPQVCAWVRLQDSGESDWSKVIRANFEYAWTRFGD